MPSAIVTSFVGALQASLSVVLVIFYGVVAAQYNLLDNESAKKVSHLSVKLFLPFLLITNVGRELSLSNGYNYVPILSKSGHFAVEKSIDRNSLVHLLQCGLIGDRIGMCEVVQITAMGDASNNVQ